MHLPLLSKRGAKEKEKRKERKEETRNKKKKKKKKKKEKEERKKKKRNVSRGVPPLENVFKCRTSALSTIR